MKHPFQAVAGRYVHDVLTGEFLIRGITDDPDKTLHELHRRYAERYLPDDAGRAPRTEADIWTAFAGKLAPG